MNLDEMNIQINKVFNDLIKNEPEMRMLFNTRRHSYMYYSRKGSKDRYFYTIRKVEHKGSQKYVAGIYRYIKSKNILKIVKKAGFGKKKTAMEKAYQWQQEAR